MLKLIFKLPESIKKWIAGTPEVRRGITLDLDMQIVCKLGRLIPPLETFSPKVARKLFSKSLSLFASKPAPIASFEDITIYQNGRTFFLRLYFPVNFTENNPCLLFFHSGGHVIGSVKDYHPILTKLCYETNFVVAAVEYSLSPEFPFPAPLEDCLAAYSWILENAKLHRIDRNRIGLLGDSAGGSLVFTVALSCLEKQIPMPKFLAALFPMADVSKEHPSYDEMGDRFFLTQSSMRWFIGHHTAVMASRLNPLASPLLHPRLSELPPCFVSVAGFDPLHDEGVAITTKLSKVELRKYPDLIHGYFFLEGISQKCRKANEDLFFWIKSFFSVYS